MRKKTVIHNRGRGQTSPGTLKTSRGQKSEGAREMGQHIKLVALAKDLSSSPGTHVAVHKHLPRQFQGI